MFIDELIIRIDDIIVDIHIIIVKYLNFSWDENIIFKEDNFVLVFLFFNVFFFDFLEHETYNFHDCWSHWRRHYSLAKIIKIDNLNKSISNYLLIIY